MDTVNLKRNSEGCASPQNSKRARTTCKYGVKCFRRNADHLKEFSHPHLNKLLTSQKDSNSISLPANLSGSMNALVVKEQLRIMRECKIENISEEPVIELYKNVKMSSTQNEESMDKVDTPVSACASTSSQGSESKPKCMSASSSDSDVCTTAKRTDEKYNIHDYCPVVAPKGQFATKWENAAPYYIFFTTITDAPLTHNEPLSVTFQELLDKSLGILKGSLQLNFMVDVSWLFAQYIFSGYRKLPITILYGADDNDLKNISQKVPNITAVKVKMADAFGTHHTKVMIFEYEDNSIRVVVSTANLYEDDWHNRVQGLWVSPKCPRLPNSEGSNTDEGNGPTNFKKDLINYLNTYKLTVLQEWIAKIRRTDFSHINVHLVVSVPGTHRESDFDKYGHTRVATLLAKNCTIPTDNGWSPNEWSILCQCSSIGSLGPTPDSWLCGQIRNSFSRITQKLLMHLPSISVIYPSFENVRKSHDHLLGGGCLPYNKDQHKKQIWLEKYLCQWKATFRNRNRAMPHIKTYCRVSPDLSQMAWFLLTSANLSKAAWGTIPAAAGGKRLTIRSYEVGVLFLPQFVAKTSTFCLDNGLSEIKDKKMLFPFPYDLPLTPYAKTDGPFFMNYLRE